MIAGDFDVFEGPLSDNTGVIRVSSGKTMSDEEKLSFNWLIEGVTGNLPNSS